MYYKFVTDSLIMLRQPLTFGDLQRVCSTRYHGCYDRLWNLCQIWHILYTESSFSSQIFGQSIRDHYFFAVQNMWSMGKFEPKREAHNLNNISFHVDWLLA